MPMNMMLSSTPLDPPMVRPRMSERQPQNALGSAKGRRSWSFSTELDAFAIVDPQSASPTLLSKSSSFALASISALHAFSSLAFTTASAEAVTPSKQSRTATAAGVGNSGVTAAGHATTVVGACIQPAASEVQGSNEMDTPFISKDVHIRPGPIKSLMLFPHWERISSATRMHISWGGTPPRLFTKQMKPSSAGWSCRADRPPSRPSIRTSTTFFAGAMGSVLAPGSP
mmetsp:Transcript_3098/g.5443  ORF Transcript_3098/g.5443 Transcript_3098/m.5443 type:complete len:228 (-) Transcript_3098:877-1560(-)